MISKLINKHKDKLLYLIFGVLTTLVNFAVFTPLCNWSLIPQAARATLSNIVAWAVAVVFAYLTNKPFVFKSDDWSLGVVIPEFIKFVGCRFGSGVIETLVIFLLVDRVGCNEIVVKITISVFVIVFNYFASKIVVFRNKKYEKST